MEVSNAAEEVGEKIFGEIGVFGRIEGGVAFESFGEAGVERFGVFLDLFGEEFCCDVL